MSRRYSVTATQAVSATANTASYPIELVTGTAAAAAVYEIILGFDAAAPVDTPLFAAFANVSAATAGTAVTPTPLDPNEGASITSAATNPTGVTLALTLPAALWSVAFNSRVTVRWAAVDPDSVLQLKAGLAASTGAVLLNSQPGTISGVNLRNYLAFRE